MSCCSKPHCDSYVIKGVRSGTDGHGHYPPRKEFRNFVKDGDHLRLYVRALQKLQSFDMEEKLGWFQIAGLHGEPFKPWMESSQRSSSDLWGGYCTHATALFPTWHRVYLLLLEQRLHELMKEIINESSEFDDKSRYLKAADTFRLPYWDWLQGYVPSVVEDMSSQNIQFGEKTNPLDSYRFPDRPGNHGITSQTDDSKNPPIYVPLAIAGATMRQPPRYDPTNEQSVQGWAQGSLSNNQAVLDALKAHPGIKQDVYNLFAHVKNYLHLSNSADPDARRQWDDSGSLEGIHNVIHGICGGDSGHMGFLEVAAMDPIFFLHHANVDRLAALWQDYYSGNHKDNWWTSAIDHYGTWDRPEDSKITPRTPLTPFNKDNRGNYWNSDDSREVHDIGYTYPGLFYGPKPVSILAKEGTETPSAIAQLLNNYNTVAQKIDKLLEKHGSDHKQKFFAPNPSEPDTILEHHTYEYDIHVSYERLELGPFSIHFFLGQPGDNPATWLQHEGHIGSVYNFVSRNEGNCANCDRQRKKRLRVVHSVSITNALLDRLNVQQHVHLPIASMDGTEAENYLKKNLHWAISSYGNLIPTETLTSLQITVSRSLVKLPLQNNQLSVQVGDKEKLEHVTRDKVGGRIIIGE